MEVKILSKFSGAWVERGQGKYMRMGVKAEYDFSLISSRVKKPIIIGLRTGVLSTTSGQAASIFRVMCEAYNLKYVCASRTGGQMYTNFIDDTFYEAALALYGLTDTSHNGYNRKSSTYVHRGKSMISCWSWSAQDEATRNIFAETIGFPDKERREEAINFFSEGGKLTQTWIDDNPI